MSLKISVLLPAYNAEKYVVEAIDSILAQTYSNFELLIADDASTDQTRNVIQMIRDPRIRHYHNTRNLGKTGTVDKLYNYVTGQLITIHDADDVSLPERFERQVKEFQHNHELGMCGTSFMNVSKDGKEVLESVVMKTDYSDILAEIDMSSQFHGPTMMVKKEILDELGCIYRPYFCNNYEDTDLAYRLAERVLSYNLSAVLYKYRIVSSSLCRQNVDIKNRNFYKIVVFLANERKDRGRDSLMEEKYEVVDDYFVTITEKYRLDTSLIHREAAAYFMYWRLYFRAIGESFKAVRKNPLHLVNLRTLQYCIRNAMFNRLRFIERK